MQLASLQFFLSWAIGLKHRSCLTGAALASVPWRWPRRCANISALLEWERARDGLLGFVLAGINFLFAMHIQIGSEIEYEISNQSAVVRSSSKDLKPQVSLNEITKYSDSCTAYSSILLLVYSLTFLGK